MAEVAQSEAVQPQSEPERTKSTDPTPAPPHFGRIVVHFARESWVEIRDRDSKVILSASGQPGSERTVEGLPPFTMVVGNAGGVRVTYNDQPIDVSAHATRNIARFTLE
jgi:cytoskeleton protein RodZ